MKNIINTTLTKPFKPHVPRPRATFLAKCSELLGDEHVLTESADMAVYLTDYRQRFTGQALAVMKPGSTGELQRVIQLCHEYRVPVVPQGGNTSLVWGSVPDVSGTAVVLSLKRLNQIRAIDTVNNTITVEAGCTLADVQKAAAEAKRLFPLSLASEGSCTIGGNLSTNAGGTAVLRYGNMRDLCLGLEVVTQQGELWDGLRALRKDNTGYDLRDVFIGAEGTLGIISAAVLKLYPTPKTRVTALAAVRTPSDALRLLGLIQNHCGATLTAFELISEYCLQLVAKHFPKTPKPFKKRHAQYVLIELSDHESEQHANALMEAGIAQALEQDIVTDAVVATSVAKAKALWHLRELIPMAQASDGPNIKHDIALPISHLAEFIDTTDALLQQNYPGCKMVTFGHLGDGNLHYNVAAPEGTSSEDFLEKQDDVNHLVHDSVNSFGGSISAEHGIGTLKRPAMILYKSDVEIELMRVLKHAFDPFNLMNPGKIID